jgi:hypothetical protein
MLTNYSYSCFLNGGDSFTESVLNISWKEECLDRVRDEHVNQIRPVYITCKLILRSEVKVTFCK